MYIEFENVDDRQDYMSIDKNTAISSEGDIFHVGDIVFHEGANDDESAEILSFYINEETYDIIAVTTKGDARISFLYFED